MASTALYRTIWRWHFYAGLFVMPFILILATTGALYLFKPQVDRWEERDWRGLATAGAVGPEAQRDAALAAFPGARFHSYRLPEAEGDAAMIHLALAGGGSMRDVFVSPQGKVLGSLDPEARIMAFDKRVHGQLLLGPRGSWLVELAASWAIVMLATGLYLWWPRQCRFAGVLWPRLGAGGRQGLRDLHAVTGFWVAGLALVLLLSGLPWAAVWGSAFKAARQEFGLVQGAQDWTIGGRSPVGDEHAAHDHGAMVAMAGDAMPSMPSMPPGSHFHPIAPVRLGEIVARAKSERLAFPVSVLPPGASPDWTVRSDTQNRPLRVTLTYDARTGAVTSRQTFSDKHPIDRVLGYSIAWHEGQLFGWINQLIGLATVLALVALAVTGFLMWRRRKPSGRLGAPPPPDERRRQMGVLVIFGVFLLLLPLFAASVAALVLIEKLVFPALPEAARWLGVPPKGKGATPQA